MAGKQAMETYRTTARAVGALFIAGMVIGIAANMRMLSLLSAPDHLATVSANSMQLAFAALLLLLTSAGDAAHGILMLPILKQRGERMAFGYFGFRIVDAVFVAVAVVFVLLQIPLSRVFLQAGAPGTLYLQGLSALSIQANLYAYNIGMIFVGVAGWLLCTMFYRARLVPRPIAVWGLVGYAILLGGSVLEVLGFNLSSLHTLPGGLWELFIGVWLIAKGFNASSFVAQVVRPGDPTAPLIPTLDPATP